MSFFLPPEWKNKVLKLSHIKKKKKKLKKTPKNFQISFSFFRCFWVRSFYYVGRFLVLAILIQIEKQNKIYLLYFILLAW